MKIGSDNSSNMLGVNRRAAFGLTSAGLGTLAVAGVLPETQREALAAPASPGAGAQVGANPVTAAVPISGIRIQLVEFCRPPRSASAMPYAMLNTLYPINDGSGRIFCNDSRGKIWEINRQTGATSKFLDLKAIRGSALVHETYHMGLRSFAFHPNYSKPGTAGYRKFFTASTESHTRSVPGGTPILGGTYPVHHHDVIAEWTVDASQRVIASSRRELMRIKMWAWAHNTDQLMFNPHAKAGDADFGLMYFGVGDGGNYPAHPDRYEQAQDLRTPLGKILRINPLANGSARYQIPADNPFLNVSGARPEIYARGLRHPQFLSFDRGGAKAFICADIGQARVEEINLVRRGANYGWPLREGIWVTDRADKTKLYRLPANDATYGFTYPVAQLGHQHCFAIAGGYVYRGSAVPALVGRYVFGDIRTGRLFCVKADDLRQGSQAPVEELVIRRNGNPVTLISLFPTSRPRADLRFGQDEAGEIYVLTKQDGVIRKIVAG